VTESRRLRPPSWRVSPLAPWYWALRELRLVVLVAFAEYVWWVADSGSRAPHVAVGLVTAVVLGAYLVVMPLWRYRVHRWETTDEAVYTQHGWFTVERRIAPLSRIQTIDTERGPLEQLFGLAHVTVTTASAAGPLKIPGLALRTADELVERLTATTQATRGDAT
jgi:uncharacterized protein